MSSLTRSTRPTLPFLPLFSSAIIASSYSRKPAGRRRYTPVKNAPGSLNLLGWPFEVDALAVIPAAVARTLEFVLAWFPIGCAAQVRAAGVNHEHAVGCAIDPDAELLLKLGVDSEREL